MSSRELAGLEVPWVFPHTGTEIRPVGALGPCLHGLLPFPADQVAAGIALGAPSASRQEEEGADGALLFPNWTRLALARGSWQGMVRV